MALWDSPRCQSNTCPALRRLHLGLPVHHINHMVEADLFEGRQQ